jgi:hypothetical protein
MPLVSVVAGTDKDRQEAAPASSSIHAEPAPGVQFAKMVQEGKRRRTLAPKSTDVKDVKPEFKPADTASDGATDFTSRINRIATAKPPRTPSEAPGEPPATPEAHRQAEQLKLELEEELKDQLVQAVLHNPGKLPIKDEVITMDVPLFALAKKPDRHSDMRVYVQGSQRVTIIPPQIGPATVFDKDLLIYAASLIVDAINRGEAPSRTLDIDSKAFLTKTQRGDGRASYEGIIDMLRRLQGTNIHTNIETGGVLQAKGFGIIESYEILARKERTELKPNPKTGKPESHEIIRVQKFRFTLSEWLYNSILDLKVLTLDDGYFGLTTAIERRLYEVARRHGGSAPLWMIEIDLLAKKVGTDQPLFQFRESLRFAIKDDRLPRFHVALDVSVKPNRVVFYTRDPDALAAALDRAGAREWFGALQRHDSEVIRNKPARGRRGRRRPADTVGPADDG